MTNDIPQSQGYTDDTEVLTLDGWKFFRDVTVGSTGDQFATRECGTGRFEWQHATGRTDESWNGEVVDVRGRTAHLRLTPTSRVLVRWADQWRSGERLKPASEITQRGGEIPCTSVWNGPSAGTVRFGRYEWDTVTFASFLGAWLAEGSLGPARKYVRKSDRKSRVGANPPSGPIVVTQLPATKGYEPYRELLTAMLGRQPSRDNGKNWVFSCSDLWHYLADLGKAATKWVPTAVKNWGKPELEAFLRFYLLGDGWTCESSNGRQSWRAVTVSRRLADDLQEVAQKMGQSATITVRPPRRGGMIAGRRIEAANCRPGYQLMFNISACRTVKPSRSHYVGMMSSVAVPGDALYVRRGGSPVWCGAS